MAIIRAGDTLASEAPDGGDVAGDPKYWGGDRAGALWSLGSVEGPIAGETPAYIAGEVLVRLAPGAGADAAAASGATVTMDADQLGIQLWQLPEGVSVEQALASLSQDPDIAFAGPNYVIQATVTPNDPYFVNQWSLNNTGQVYGYTANNQPVSGKADADIDAAEAWGVQQTAPIVVAVIDTGIDYTHPDLDGNIWRNADEIAGNGIDDDRNGYVDDYYGYDFVNRDGNPIDDNGHGTHVAGTIGAEGGNGIGVAGIAWSVQLMALKFLNAQGSGSTAGAIEALNYAVANGAQISNNSWGGGSFNQGLLDAIGAAGNAGHLFVTAAGNDSRDIDVTPSYPASYAPANLISVASTDAFDALSSFSNYGDVTVDLAAPGSSILSTYKGGYAFLSGTSMATPHVTGAAALVWAENPSLTALEVKQILLDTVDVLPSLAGKVASGGRLNVAAALEAADATAPTVATASIAAAVGARAEGSAGTTSFSFTVSLDAPAKGTQTLAYAVAGSGVAPANATDFGGALPAGTVTFQDGQTSRSITVPVSGDTAVEADEAFSVTLSAPSAGLRLGTTTASGTILNDDTVPAGSTITGTSSANTLSGGTGDDTIYGMNGNDRLTGLAGNDWLDGGAGADTMTGGAGDDRYVLDNGSDRVVESSNEGADTVASSVTHTLANNVENLILTGTGAINATGNSGANRLVGNAGANTLNGAAGADTLEGGGGNDIYVVDNAGDVAVELDGAGTDMVQSSVAFTLGAFVERLTLTGSSGITGTGNDIANLITGNNGANRLAGGAGDDTLVGGNGADSLLGEAGNDSIYGGNGADSLTGGDGLDLFVFRATGESPRGSGRDVVTDFDTVDVIDLRTIDANTSSSGDQAFSFIGTSSFSGVRGQLRYDLTSLPGSAIVQGDTNGDRTADIEIQVRGVSSMNALDFLL
ncbi:MAG: S8 family serine peptidase [Alphaproteobacteria bacterium]|nr:S8 family serine peptidase [Alphaproteobacteria bacterium]